MIAAVVLAAALAPADTAFVRRAMEFNNRELTRARAAIDSTDIRLQDYAQRITSDITQANEELVVIARHYHVLLYTMPSPAPGAPATNGPPGVASVASRPYLETEIQEQRSVLGSLNREAAGGGTLQLRDFARRMSVIVRENLALAERYLKENQHHGRL